MRVSVVIPCSMSMLSVLQDSPLSCVLLERSALTNAKLLPEEEILLDGIGAESRRESILLGREAAHQALNQLGVTSPTAVLRGAGGEPLFPRGFVGSISHTVGAAVAVAGATGEFSGLGIDLELADRKVESAILQRIAIPAENAWAMQLPEQRAFRSLLIFSAKESVFKALYPLCKKRMNFKDVFVRYDEESDALIATLLTDLNEHHRAGDLILVHAVREGKFLLTCAMIAAEEIHADE